MYDWADISDLECPSGMYSWADISNLIPQTEVDSKNGILVENAKPVPSYTQTEKSIFHVNNLMSIPTKIQNEDRIIPVDYSKSEPSKTQYEESVPVDNLKSVPSKTQNEEITPVDNLKSVPSKTQNEESTPVDNLKSVPSKTQNEESTPVDNLKPVPSKTQTDDHQSSTAGSSLEEKKKPSNPRLPKPKTGDKSDVFHCSIAELSKVKRSRTKPDVYQSPTQFKVFKKPKKSPNPSPKPVKQSVISHGANSEDSAKAKRNRARPEIYQSPTVLKSYTEQKKPSSISSKPADFDESIIFSKYEFLAVRNEDDGFYLCQTLQNIYKTTDRISIRWLSQDEDRPDLYYLDYEDETELDCVLTNVNLNKIQKDRYQLSKYDLLRTQNQLKHSIFHTSNNNDN